MKPGRKPSGAASKASKPKSKNKPDKTAAQQAAGDQDPQPYGDNHGIQPKATRKRKAVPSSSVPRKVKGQEDLKPMSKSSIAALENIMDLSILTTLALTRTQKKECTEHLNTVKNRFLAHCAELRIHAKEQKILEHLTHRHQEETRKLEAGKKNLSSLEEDLKAVVSALERTKEQTVSLQQACSTLREEVEEEEEKAKQLLEIREKAVLNLPSFPPEKDERTLAAQLREMIPDADHGTIARKVGEIFQKSEAIRDAQALLTQAHKHVDRLTQQPLQ